MSRLIIKMKRQLYLPLLITLLVSLVSGVLPLGQGIAYASPGWVSPTGFVDGGSVWTDEPLAYDEDTLTFAYADALKGGWTDYLELTHAALNCDKVQVWVSILIVNINKIEVDVYYGGAWHNIYSEAITADQFVEYPIGSTQSVTSMRIRFYSTKASVGGCRIHEADFNEVVAPDISNTPTTWDVNSPNPVAENTTYETGLTHFTLTNNSSFAINVTISGENMTGAGETWTLSNDGTNGTSTYGLKAGRATESYNIIVKASSPNYLVENLAGSGTTQQWGLQLLTPTTFGDGTTKSGTVTLTATQV